jgi:hypothetical protein
VIPDLKRLPCCDHERGGKDRQIMKEHIRKVAVPGTYDPEIIDWTKTGSAGEKGPLEFGFLKGLSDETKLILARERWCVSEYVPFGKEGNVYISRRLHYLDELESLSRKPAP